MEDDQVGIEVNRQILRLLIKGKGRDGIDEMDNVNQSTPLQVACEQLNDLQMVKILVEEGEADINSVNKDNMMPLSIVKERIEKKGETQELKAIYDYLKEKGAVLNWKDIPR